MENKTRFAWIRARTIIHWIMCSSLLTSVMNIWSSQRLLFNCSCTPEPRFPNCHMENAKITMNKEEPRQVLHSSNHHPNQRGLSLLLSNVFISFFNLEECLYLWDEMNQNELGPSCMCSLPCYRIHLFLLAVVSLLLFFWGKRKRWTRFPVMICLYLLPAALPCQHAACSPSSSHSCADLGIPPRPAQQLQRQESVNPAGNWSVKRCNELRQNRAIDTGTNVRPQQAVNSSPSSAPPEPGGISLLCWGSTGVTNTLNLGHKLEFRQNPPHF